MSRKECRAAGLEPRPEHQSSEAALGGLGALGEPIRAKVIGRGEASWIAPGRSSSTPRGIAGGLHACPWPLSSQAEADREGTDASPGETHPRDAALEMMAAGGLRRLPPEGADQ